jgi:lactate dehydrogenase-like 2-hydroxyacid dehydrogenase
MKPELLVTTPIYAPTLAALEHEFTLHRLWTAREPETYIRERSARTRGVVTTGLVGLSRSRMDALPGLEIIACFGTPNGTVDLAAAKARGVAVTNTPDSSAAPVADLALGLLIAVMRRICASDRFIRAGKWREGPPPMGRELGGKTCGIVGLGRIGKGIAQRAAAFGMAVCYHGPHRKEDIPHPYYPDLEAMARQVDCLVLACPLTPATRDLIDARILDALGPGGFLVNVARGPVVNREALIAALAEKRIAGAGLDVFWDEPEVPPELIAMENVVLQPHMGSSTQEIREERGRKLLANLRAHFAGKPLLTPMA